MTIDTPESVVLPDTLSNWPWKRKVNPHYLQVKGESSAWIRNILKITPGLQRLFDLGEFELLAAHVYPLESKEVLRSGCDLMYLFALYDEYTDGATPHEAQQLATMVMDAMCNPDKVRPAGECPIVEVARQFWNLSSKSASEGACRRFLKSFDEYTISVVQQAHDRARKLIRNIDDYFTVRLDTSGARPVLDLIEFELNLPDQVFEDPVIQRLINASTKMIILTNDLYSYNVEQARGDGGHNIVTILMHHMDVDLNGAMKWIEDYYAELAQNFLGDLRCVPFFGIEVQREVEHYLNGLGSWIRGNDSWSFESRRYFIEDGLEIQQSRKLVLLP
ncbi:hypothetical protein C0992_005530, partial [Termitomyces sp. T32_za158]